MKIPNRRGGKPLRVYNLQPGLRPASLTTFQGSNLLSRQTDFPVVCRSPVILKHTYCLSFSMPKEAISLVRLITSLSGENEKGYIC
jgi:hypothetical protein